MTIGCKIYSPVHAEALQRSQTAQAHFNLLSITILREAHFLGVDQRDVTTIDVYD